MLHNIQIKGFFDLKVQSEINYTETRKDCSNIIQCKLNNEAMCTLLFGLRLNDQYRSFAALCAI